MVLVATQVKRRRGTTAENDAFTGAEGEITVDTEKHELRVHDGQTQGGFVIGSGGSGRNIGDTFMTKRTDTGLAGAVECNGATYNTTDFTGNGSIGELLEAGKLDYVSLSAYSTAIAQTGWCDKIGWDGTGNTQFRVPTISPRHCIIKSQEPTADNDYTWYKLYADGWVEQGGTTSLPNTTNGVLATLPIEMADRNYSVAACAVVNDGTWISTWIYRYSTTQIRVDMFNHTGNRSKGTTTWQVSGISSITPQTNTRVMIQIANGATDQALETCTGVLADVAGLKDMSNITADGKEVCANLAMPSNRYVDLTLGASGSTYTAPADGYIFLAFGNQANASCYIKTSTIKTGVYNVNFPSIYAPVQKGGVFTVDYSGGTPTGLYFVYAQGAQ